MMLCLAVPRGAVIINNGENQRFVLIQRAPLPRLLFRWLSFSAEMATGPISHAPQICCIGRAKSLTR